VCLVHKMDLVAIKERERKLTFHEDAIRANSAALRSTGAGALGVDVHPTTIWDESLYAAWSQIVHRLVPNINSLEKKVHSLCAACGADEAVLFERTTFLVLSTASRRPHKDGHRHEKLSNIVKQFKLSCANASAEFAAMTICGSRFKAILESLTEHTFILLVVSDSAVREYEHDHEYACNNIDCKLQLVRLLSCVSATRAADTLPTCTTVHAFC